MVSMALRSEQSLLIPSLSSTSIRRGRSPLCLFARSPFPCAGKSECVLTNMSGSPSGPEGASKRSACMPTMVRDRESLRDLNPEFRSFGVEPL